jgi:diaminopropionate ammonia-lyase
MYVLNSQARRGECRSLFTAEEFDDVQTFWDGLADAPATPLIELSQIARELGIASLALKDESTRFGLTAFKIIGVTYVIHRLLGEGKLARDVTLASASTGNHGLALAREGRRLGMPVKIYVPRGTTAARIAAIARDGAEVVVVEGNYERAVEQAARDAEQFGWQVVSDTSSPGYEQIPRWIMAGYSRIVMEAVGQMRIPPDIVLVQAGVGGLACAVLSWLSFQFGSRRPYTILCEPVGAACALESARAGRPVVIEGDLPTMMTGLQCGRVSSIAWPVIAATADAFVAIPDELSVAAIERLAQAGVMAGPSGACGMAALQAVAESRELNAVREASRLGDESRVLIINTEGSWPGSATPPGATPASGAAR